MRNVLTPTVQELLVTTCCPLSSYVPEELMGNKSIKDWHNCLSSYQNVHACRSDDTCISILDAAMQASAFPELEEVSPMVSNQGWSVELTFKFSNKYDGTFFCNSIKKSVIKYVVVTVRCEFKSWLPGVCKTCYIADIQSSLRYLSNISSSVESKFLLREAESLLILATAFSAEPELHEWSCVSGENRGSINFAFRFNNAIDVLSFIPMVRRVLPIAESAKT